MKIGSGLIFNPWTLFLFFQLSQQYPLEAKKLPDATWCPTVTFFSLLSSGTVLESPSALHDIYILESIGQSCCRHSLSLELYAASSLVASGYAIWAEMSPK